MAAKIDTLPQDDLVPALRDAIDAVRIADPLRGPSPAARRKLRRMIRENPHGVRTPHVLHNIGKARAQWLALLVEVELANA
jgi:hypothetical protein